MSISSDTFYGKSYRVRGSQDEYIREIAKTQELKPGTILNMMIDFYKDHGPMRPDHRKVFDRDRVLTGL